MVVTEEDLESPLLIFACSRADYLRRTLGAVLRHHPMRSSSRSTSNTTNTGGRLMMVGSPVIISQDGNDDTVRAVIEEFRDRFSDIGVTVYRMEHDNRGEGAGGGVHLRGDRAYRALARHYGWALGRTFSAEAYRDPPPTTTLRSDAVAAPPPPPRRVIILEEDIEIAPDFFCYLSSLTYLLDRDPTLLAVSAFNDNGGSDHASDPLRLLRSDFFPGLGWMMTGKVWEEIGPQWPEGWWDDWMREPNVRRGRQIVRPEVSRTYHFGSKSGASSNAFGSKLSRIKLNDESGVVRWEDEDLSYLERDRFREDYYRRVEAARICSPSDAMREVGGGDVRVVYENWERYRSLARKFDLMDDEKAGVPRTAFENMVEFRPPRREGIKYLIFLTPPPKDTEMNLLAGRDMEMTKFSQMIRLRP